MPQAYDYSVDRAVVHSLVECSPRERRLLVDAFEQLSRHPFTRGDYSFVSTGQRVNEVIDLGSFLLTYWSDHGARTVRILHIERTSE